VKPTIPSTKVEAGWYYIDHPLLDSIEYWCAVKGHNLAKRLWEGDRMELDEDYGRDPGIIYAIIGKLRHLRERIEERYGGR